MSQRASEYPRRADEDYKTPQWVARAIADYLRCRDVIDVWEPAAGAGALAAALLAEGFAVASTTDDFLARTETPRAKIDAIVTNPPYGPNGRSELACEFIRQALVMPVRIVAMLLRADFDSAKGRVALFRDNPRFAGKITLLDRIVWFEPAIASPSENHAWFIWERAISPRPGPWIRYAGKSA